MAEGGKKRTVFMHIDHKFFLCLLFFKKKKKKLYEEYEHSGTKVCDTVNK